MVKKYICVSGADHGLGLELVRKYLQEGFHVFAGHYDQNKNFLKELEDAYGEQLHAVLLDISKDDSVQNFKEQVLAVTDQVEILINNAAILGDIQATVMDPINMEQIQAVFNVNALGALRMSNALLPLILKSEKKLLINISSEAGSIEDSNRVGWFGYCMSKAALNMESKLISNYIGQFGGKVLAIHPGHLRTYMNGKIDESAPTTPDIAAGQIYTISQNLEQYKDQIYIEANGKAMNW